MSILFGFDVNGASAALASAPSTSTLLAFASILLGSAWVAFATYRNAQASVSIAQLLQATEGEGPQRGRRREGL